MIRDTLWTTKEMIAKLFDAKNDKERDKWMKHLALKYGLTAK